MKIEKISDNQIRCTLTREDLASRKINLRELAYGSEKAKLLFQDMMQEAFREYGFKVENSPLMIEAIPLSGDKIVLIITRVDNPEELDSRFARFSQEDGGNGFSETLSESLSGLDDILNLISRLSSGSESDSGSKNQKKNLLPDIQPLGDALQPAESSSEAQAREDTAPVSTDSKEPAVRLTRFFLFHSLDNIIQAASVAGTEYAGWNSLYKNPEDDHYYLILRMEDTLPEQFNRVCNVLTEYGVAVEYTSGMEEFFTEHMDTIISANALQTLSEIS